MTYRRLLLTSVFAVAVAVNATPAFAGSKAADAHASTAHDARLTTYGQLFSSYDQDFSDAQNFNEFRLERAQLDVVFAWQKWAGFDIGVEAVRSAGPDSLFGIDQNSIVARFKYGFASATPKLGPGVAQLRAGLIPELWIESVEAGYELRGVSPLAAESSRMFDTSDLGASAGYSAWDGLAQLRISLTNGEGRNQVELNSGKNTTIVLDVRPLTVHFWGGEGVLGLHAGWRDGSQGLGQRRNHRAMAAVTFRHPRLGAGVEYERAFGYLGRGSRDADVFGAWANVAAVSHWLNIFGRFDHLTTDLDTDSSNVDSLYVGVFTDLLPRAALPEARRLRLYVGYRHRAFGDNAGPVPGAPAAANVDAVFATVEARGLLTSNTTEPSP